MAASHDPLDDRQHGHAIRRRQGGRTSIYHDQLYPVGAIHKQTAETFETYDGGDLVRAIENGEPGAVEEQARRAKYAPESTNMYGQPGVYPSAPVGSDGSTGAY